MVVVMVVVEGNGNRPEGGTDGRTGLEDREAVSSPAVAGGECTAGEWQGDVELLHGKRRGKRRRRSCFGGAGSIRERRFFAHHRRCRLQDRCCCCCVDRERPRTTQEAVGGEDPCGSGGNFFRAIGRLPRSVTQVRGVVEHLFPPNFQGYELVQQVIG